VPLPSPPRDASNRYADDARAAALGQKLFFDAGFSGPLLDGDNDGTQVALGVRGETGKVSCAGCHVAAAGFLDDRSRGKQISLAAGWNLRRTPSLLDVGHARLLMWDGSRDSLHSQPFGPIENPNEMNSSRLHAAEQIFARSRRSTMRRAFPRSTRRTRAATGRFAALPPAMVGPATERSTTGCRPRTRTRSRAW
jgi:cytochrome c peroxidase